MRALLAAGNTAPGVAASVYARQHGLTLASLYYWRRKVRLVAAVVDGTGDTANQFVALRVVARRWNY